MIQTATIPINDKIVEAISVQTENSFILIVKAAKGFLGCGYLSADTADKLGEAVAIVVGVKDFEDMMDAQVVKASSKAKELGISEGMTGREALEKMI